MDYPMHEIKPFINQQINGFKLKSLQGDFILKNHVAGANQRYFMIGFSQ